MAKGLINSHRLIDAVLAARPEATSDDVRRLAPTMAELPDGELEARLAQARRRKMKAAGRLPDPDVEPLRGRRSW